MLKIWTESWYFINKDDDVCRNLQNYLYNLLNLRSFKPFNFTHGPIQAEQVYYKMAASEGDHERSIWTILRKKDCEQSINVIIDCN